jgi:hypothetical protein
MATNREMLKEAIADAKAVKETAIANAKVALEEAFTPQLKSMFAAKLQEMASDDELEEAGFGGMDPKGHGNIEDDSSLYETEKNMMEVDLEELLRELELEEDDTLNEAEEEEESEESEEPEESDEGGEPLDLEDLTDEDLKSMIEDVIADMIKSGELEAGHEGEKGEESEEYEESESEEVDLAELLREIEEMEEMDYMEEEKEPVNEVLFSTGILFVALPFLVATGAVFGYLINYLKNRKKIDAAKEAELRDLFKSNKKKAGMEALSLLGGTKAAAAELGKDSEFLKAAEQGTTEITEISTESTNETELYEAYSTIKVLKSELNEINLLNAKLLYTNKIFKAKNLNESQKVKVLTSFDRAKNVGEVKMVFETLNEGIKVSKNIIKENLGRASKGTMTPNVNKPIVESNEAFLRMQKLAGII